MNDGVLVLDSETCFSMKEKYKGGKVKAFTDYGSPYNDGNKIVLVGTCDIQTGQYYEWKPERLNDLFEYMKGFKTIVGHNIKYDANWLRRCGWDWRNHTLDDTLIREYILRGGKDVFSKLGLDKLAPEYGGTNKIDIIKKMWKDGVNTDEIPYSLLSEYLYYDVYNTALIYVEQDRQKDRQRFDSMLRLNRDLNKVTAEMEYNGFCIDIGKAEEIKHDFEKLVAAAETEVYLAIENNYPEPENFKLNSPMEMAKLLYSREFRTLTPEEIANGVAKPKDYWKENMKRCKTQKAFDKLVDECFVKLPYGFNVKPIKKFVGVNGFGAGKTVIEALEERGGLSQKAERFITALTDLSRKKTWLDKNYYGLINEISDDGRIHGSFNQAGTRSGRYSSSQPNLQNLPAKHNNGGANNIRQMIVSRYGEDGCIVAPDYGQLELRAVLELANDAAGRQHYEDGVDIHTDKAKWAVDYYHGQGTWDGATDDERKTWRGNQKNVNFGLIFGLFPKDELEEAMHKAFYNDYQRVKPWNDEVHARIRANQEYADPALDGYAYNFEGATHSNFYRGYDTKGKGWKNKGLNYPVQGFAGRIMQCAMIGVYEKVKDEPNIHFIGQVHDEIVLDCHKKVLDKCMNIVYKEMVEVNKRFKSYFGYDIQIPMGVDLEWGVNWFDVKEYEETK